MSFYIAANGDYVYLWQNSYAVGRPDNRGLWRLKKSTNAYEKVFNYTTNYNHVSICSSSDGSTVLVGTASGAYLSRNANASMVGGTNFALTGPSGNFNG